jgi:hypothetical protein
MKATEEGVSLRNSGHFDVEVVYLRIFLLDWEET